MKFRELAQGWFFHQGGESDYVLQKVPFHITGHVFPSNAIDVASGMHLLLDAGNPVVKVDEPEDWNVKWDGKRPDIVTTPLGLVHREDQEEAA